MKILYRYIKTRDYYSNHEETSGAVSVSQRRGLGLPNRLPSAPAGDGTIQIRQFKGRKLYSSLQHVDILYVDLDPGDRPEH
jgi:hypothetical protein